MGLDILSLNISVHAYIHAHARQYARGEKTLHWELSGLSFPIYVVPCSLANICYDLVTQFPYL